MQLTLAEMMGCGFKCSSDESVDECNGGGVKLGVDAANVVVVESDNDADIGEVDIRKAVWLSVLKKAALESQVMYTANTTMQSPAGGCVAEVATGDKEVTLGVSPVRRSSRLAQRKVCNVKSGSVCSGPSASKGLKRHAEVTVGSSSARLRCADSSKVDKCVTLPVATFCASCCV